MLIKTIQTELLTTYVYDSRADMGKAAAGGVLEKYQITGL